MNLFRAKFESWDPFIKVGLTIVQLQNISVQHQNMLFVRVVSDNELKCGWCRLNVIIETFPKITYISHYEPDNYSVLQERIIMLEDKVKELAQKLEEIINLRCI